MTSEQQVSSLGETYSDLVTRLDEGMFPYRGVIVIIASSSVYNDSRYGHCIKHSLEYLALNFPRSFIL